MVILLNINYSVKTLRGLSYSVGVFMFFLVWQSKSCGDKTLIELKIGTDKKT